VTGPPDRGAHPGLFAVEVITLSWPVGVRAAKPSDPDEAFVAQWRDARRTRGRAISTI
jgi:hypothetical protein